MPRYAEVDGIGTLEFPDETTDEVIARTVKKQVLARQSAEAGREIETAERFIGAVDQVTSPVYGLGRISLGGLGRLTKAAAEDVLTPGIPGTAPALASELMGEEPPLLTQAELAESAVKSGLAKAAAFVPVVGASMLVAPARVAQVATRLVGGIAPTLAPEIGVAASRAVVTAGAMGAAGYEASDGSVAEGLKSAATGAALPFLGLAGRAGAGLATGTAVNRGVTALANPIVQRAIESGSAQVPINALLLGEMMMTDEYRNATPEKQNRMLVEGVVGNLAFAGPDVLHAFNPRAQPMATRNESPSVDVARMLGSAEITGIPEALASPTESRPFVQRYPSQPFAQIPGGPVPASPLTARALQDAQNLLLTPGTGRAMETLESRYGEPAEPIIGERPSAVRADVPEGEVSFRAEAPTLTSNVPEMTAEALRAEARAAGEPVAQPAAEESPVSGSALPRQMALIPGGRQAAKALSQAAANARRKAQAGLVNPQAPAAAPAGARPAQQQQQAPPPGGAPPAATPPAGAQPAGAAGPAPAGVRTKTLADAYRVFTPPPKPPGKGAAATVKGGVEKFRTAFIAQKRPLAEWEENVIRYYGLPKRPQDAAAFFETLKGASGQAQADTMKFDRDVIPKLNGISELDFSTYMLAKRIADRLTVDPVERNVADWSVADAQGILADLQAKLTPDQYQRMEAAGQAFQVHMDNALQRQVDSHRMSQERYDDIKAKNSFYAPFGVMKYLAADEPGRPGGGRNIDTQAEYTKAIEGINDTDFRLADMIGMARRQIATSRILAEKNLRMHRVLEIAEMDTQEVFAKRLYRVRNKDGNLEWEKPPEGKEVVTAMVEGKPVHIAVDPQVAKAIQETGSAAGDVNAGAMALTVAGKAFRAGATTLNAAFQFVNAAAADQPRLALVSKLGPREWADVVKYPMDFVHSLYSAMAGNRMIPGVKTPKLFEDFLESGAAGATVQEYLTTDAIKPKAGGEFGKTTPTSIAKSILFSPARFSKAMEETTKIMGTKRAMRMKGVSSGEELAKVAPELVTEVRRYSGSPDFSRIGKVTDEAMLNLLFVFSNARVQGTAADLGRLAGKDGPKVSAKTWAKLAGAIGIPTAILAYINSLPGNKEDYEKLSENEKRNYWLFPKNKYIVNEQGQRVRDYWRAPKRETAKLIANVVESGINFAKERDPKALAEWGASALEDMAPVNVTGRNLRERGESVISSMNPLVKAPFELFTGRNTYQHRDVVSDPRQLIGDPEFQYSKRTQEIFKQIAQAMPDWAPEFVRSPARLENLNQNIFAGLFTQFLPTKGIEGRSGFEEWRLLRRFQTQGYVDNPEFRAQMEVLQRDQANESLIRERKADEIIAAHPGDNRAALREAIQHFGERDKDGVDRVADKLRAKMTGVTREDQQLLNLAPRQRAQFITEQLADMDRENSREYLRTLIKRKVLSEATALEMQKLKMVLTNKAD